MTPNSEIDPSLTMTRRHLVLAGGVAGAALYLGGLPSSAAAADAPAYLSRASYARRTGARFSAKTVGGRTVTLRLTAVTDLVRARTEPALRGRDDAFALTFSGASADVLGSGIRRLNHPALGWFSVFITPVGPATTVQAYEVVVDRMPR